MSFCEKKLDSAFTHSEKESYRRTFRILEKRGLLNRAWGYSHLQPRHKYRKYWVSSYVLTDKGKEIADRIDKELKDLIEEFEYLI